VLLRSHVDLRSYILTAITVFVVFRSRMNPLWLVAAGAIAGIVGIV
jgi:hypothetical protein